ncbi:MAG: hypothetical protein VW455_09285 [Nitrospinota bacterium]
MDMLVVEQIWAVVLFGLGGVVLSICRNIERKEEEFEKDAKNRYGKKKSDGAKSKSLRGTLMTLLGTGLCLGGMILFLMHV